MLDIEENGVRLRLTVVDTPGFGDFVNNDNRLGMSKHNFPPILTSSPSPLLTTVGSLFLMISSHVSTPFWNKKIASTDRRLSTTAFMHACTLSNPLVIRKPVAFLRYHLLTGDRLKQIDIEFMRRLHQKVNLIPVIAKADTLTEDEIIAFKHRVCIHVILLTITYLCLDSLGYPSS